MTRTATGMLAGAVAASDGLISDGAADGEGELALTELTDVLGRGAEPQASITLASATAALTARQVDLGLTTQS